MKKKKLLYFVPVGIVLLLVILFFCYTGNYYHAKESALQYVKSTENITVLTGSDNELAFIPDEIVAGVVFYPGGLVEYEAYAPLLMKLADNNIMAVVVKMPFKLAMLNADGAFDVISKYSEVEEWYIGGHSLGGVYAARYASSHSEDFKGVFLLASYSIDDLSSYNMKTLCVYGSEDGVLNMKKYEKEKSNLPTDNKEVIIDGGCHAFFGSYGAQKGDGIPKISEETQIEQTALEICDFIKQ